jgi:predicted transposase YbfD/YdcC
MESSADEIGSLCETVVFLGYFKDLPDARQSGKVKYRLDEILLLCLLAIVAGAETITDIARFGRVKLALLRRFRPFEDGTPAHDHLGDILATLDTEAFERCFVAWVAAQTGVPGEVVAIDGKTVRRSGSKTTKKKEKEKDPKGPIHIVSAFAARQRLVLGQVKVAEKSNEIIAIPKLLQMLEIERAVVTIDAMGCQREIAQTIIDKKADYILALKGNQGTLKDDVKLFVDEQKAVDFRDAEVSRDKTVDGDHGRIETREITVIHDVEWLQDRHDWPGLKSVVVVESTREVGGKIDREMRLYITSLILLANQIGPMIRAHWMIENGLHWVLDMIFRDDECRVRTDNAPANLATFKHMAYNVMRRAATKDSMRLRRKVAAWDDDFLASLIAA